MAESKAEQVKKILQIATGLKSALEAGKVSRTSFDYLIKSLNEDLRKLGASERV